MEVTVHLDGDPAVREEGFFESKVTTLENTIRALQFDNAELVRTNDELAEIIDTSDEWIRTRTGIVERRFLEEDEPTSKMAIAVGADLLRKRGLSGDDIDLIIVKACHGFR